MSRFESYSDLPGQATIAARPGRTPRILACLAGAAWPPLWLTLPFWRPHAYLPGRDMDWRLVVMLIGLITVPLALYRVLNERKRDGRPGTRLGVVWRFMMYGGLAAALVQIVVALGMSVMGWFEAGDVMQALGATETTLLIFGVGGLKKNAPPLLTDGADITSFADPVPQSLVLTAIVIGFATTALFLVVMLASRGLTGTDHVDGKEKAK